jgi:hypothetical protein
MKITSLKEKNAQNQYKIAKGLATALAGIAGISGKELFLLTQSFGIGQAIVAAHTAAAQTLATPGLDPFTKMALAAKIKAAGYLEAGAIAATTLGSIATGGASVTGGGYGPVSTTNYGSTYEPEPQDTKGTLTVNVYGDISDPDSFVDALVEKINDAADRDVFVNFARGVRAA